MHHIFDLDLEGESTVVFTESVTTDADGTTITSYNSDRNTSNSPTLITTHTPSRPVGGYGGTTIAG